MDPFCLFGPLRELNPIQFSDIHIKWFGHEPTKSKWVERKGQHLTLNLVREGKGSLEFGNSPKREVPAGSLFCTIPGVKLSYGPDRNTSWREYYIILEGPGTQRWIESGFCPSDGSVLPVHDSSWKLLEELFKEMNSNAPLAADHAIHLVEALLLSSHAITQPSTEPIDSVGKIRAIMEHCQSHYSQDIDFQELSDQFGISYSAVRIGMRKLTGMPPGKYLIRLRIEAAQQLLKSTSLGIQEVGCRIGIPHPVLFSRTFKNHTGMTPRGFRDALK